LERIRQEILTPPSSADAGPRLPTSNDFVSAGGLTLNDTSAFAATQPVSFDISSLQELFRTSVYSSHRIPEVRQTLIYCYAILILCGTTFNLAVLFALLYFREQTFTNIANIFVFTLAASDVVLCGVSMPIQLYYGIDENSQVDTALCRTLFAGFGIPMYVSCLTILLIAIDRHRLIIKPTAPRVSLRTALGLICTTILFSALNAVPVGLYTESKGIKGFQSFCVETWPSATFRLVYSVAIFIVHFLLPLLVSGGLYLEIYRRLATRPEQLSVSKESERRKRRTTTLLVCVVVCFAICWTPWCLFSLLVEIDAFLTKGTNDRPLPTDLGLSELTTEGCMTWLNGGHLGGSSAITSNQTTGDEMGLSSDTNGDRTWLQLQATATKSADGENSFIRGTHFTLVDMILKLWAMGSACVNPFLYGWLNRPIREAMISLYESISVAICFRSPRRRGGQTNTLVPSNPAASIYTERPSSCRDQQTQSYSFRSSQSPSHSAPPAQPLPLLTVDWRMGRRRRRSKNRYQDELPSQATSQQSMVGNLRRGVADKKKTVGDGGSNKRPHLMGTCCRRMKETAGGCGVGKTDSTEAVREPLVSHVVVILNGPR
uniref:G_PROTEIN_RECEP_F1_2 domain-containing protein n=1 Tax=Schistocephalus solidus TaxID=70667 RepID=A0A183TL07_SCHSO